jgi:flagellar biosynthesis/type III secretory pathway chaperone
VTVHATDVHSHAGRILNDESQLLQELEQLLHQETAIVRGDDVAAIARIGATRHDCIAALTRLEVERAASCRMLSFGEGRVAFEKLLDWCDADGALRQRWQSNLQQARRCRDLNERNGAVVAVQLNHVQQLLAAMRGGAAPAVYSPQATRTSGFATRELAQA